MTQEKSFKSKAWEFFQSLGKTFMFPVSLLAFMGLLLGVGSSVTSPSTIKSFPFLGGELTQLTFGFIAMVGGFAFTYLPIMFAMAIPMGLATRNKAVGAFAGFVGYMLMNLSINYYLTVTHQLADAAVAPDAQRLAAQRGADADRSAGNGGDLRLRERRLDRT